MRGTYHYGERHWYPHMSPAEAILWGRFIKQFPDVYDSVDYDVKIGKIPDFIEADPDPSAKAQAPLYQYKIDVVGFKNDQTDIIELKQRANMRSLGQVIGYRDLYVRYIKPGARPKSIIITDELMPEMDLLAFQAGVQIVVV